MKSAPEMYKVSVAMTNAYREQFPDDVVTIQPLGPYEKVQAGDVYESPTTCGSDPATLPKRATACTSSSPPAKFPSEKSARTA